MPTTAVTAQTAPGPWSTTGSVITWTAADVANGNHVVAPSSGTKWILLARNVHAANTYTVTVTSVADNEKSRTGDVSAVNVTAGNQRIIQLVADGWMNGSGNIAFAGNNASIEFAFFTI